MGKLEYAVPGRPGPMSPVVATLSDGTLVKQRVARMRACDQKNEKGKICAGHLKRFFHAPEELERQFGRDVELYRCERCKTLYLPHPEEPPRTGTLSW